MAHRGPGRGKRQPRNLRHKEPCPQSQQRSTADGGAVPRVLTLNSVRSRVARNGPARLEHGRFLNLFPLDALLVALPVHGRNGGEALSKKPRRNLHVLNIFLARHPPHPGPRTLSFISPRLKCFGLTRNSSPSMDVSSLSGPDTTGSYRFTSDPSACSPLMCHAR